MTARTPAERWILSDAPGSGGGVPSVASTHREMVMARLFERIDGTLAQRAVPPAPVSEVRSRTAPPPPGPVRPPAHAGPTVELPVWSADARPQGIREAPPLPPALRPPEALTGTKQSGDPETAAPPLVVRAEGGSFVTVPRLSRQQYASLRAELAVTPKRLGTILRDYGVESEAALRALCAWWDTCLAEPTMRAAYERDLAEFEDYLRRRGG